MTDREIKIKLSKLFPNKIHHDIHTERFYWNTLDDININGKAISITEWPYICWLIEQDINKFSERVNYLNALRRIVGETMPKNKSGNSIVSDFDLIRASWQQRAEAILSKLEKKKGEG